MMIQIYAGEGFQYQLVRMEQYVYVFDVSENNNCNEQTYLWHLFSGHHWAESPPQRLRQLERPCVTIKGLAQRNTNARKLNIPSDIREKGKLPIQNGLTRYN